MKHCLELAQKGFGNVAPNPMAGCVVVANNKVIGVGYHKRFGEAHAEVNAINTVKDKSLLKDSILYVNLEPCSHFGKTPPCADLIIRYKIKYVVIGTLDPNPLVAGGGIQKLVSSGCDVKVGLLESQCRELNRRFFTFHEMKRPYIILKWAETSDKYIGVIGKRLQVTGPKATTLVHQWRSEEQAIMVGTTTALTDNPQLTVRNSKGKNPLRVVMDKDLKIPSRFHLLDGKIPTLVFTSKNKPSKQNLEYLMIDFKENTLKQILDKLYKRNIQSLIVEGGAQLLNSFIELNLWDEARILQNKNGICKLTEIKSGFVPAPVIKGKTGESQVVAEDKVVLIHRRLESTGLSG